MKDNKIFLTGLALLETFEVTHFISVNLYSWNKAHISTKNNKLTNYYDNKNIIDWKIKWLKF